ncbi:hypothetical protein ACFL2K_00680 [Candidatus Margulisiibacteriota bacterium]
MDNELKIKKIEIAYAIDLPIVAVICIKRNFRMARAQKKTRIIIPAGEKKLY